MGPRLPGGARGRRGDRQSCPTCRRRSCSSCRPTPAAAALTALRAIAEQGEGLEAPRTTNDSHFLRFLAIYRALKALGAGVADVVRPVAANPTTADATAASRTTWTPRPTITHPEALLWAHLFNVRYRKLLVSLSHAFELANDPTDLTTLSPRGGLIHRCFAEMYNLRAIAGLLVRLPVGADDADGPRAGPPFQMPYTLALPRPRPTAGGCTATCWTPPSGWRPAARCCRRRATARTTCWRWPSGTRSSAARSSS